MTCEVMYAIGIGPSAAKGNDMPPRIASLTHAYTSTVPTDVVSCTYRNSLRASESAQKTLSDTRLRATRQSLTLKCSFKAFYSLFVNRKQHITRQKLSAGPLIRAKAFRQTPRTDHIRCEPADEAQTMRAAMCREKLHKMGRQRTHTASCVLALLLLCAAMPGARALLGRSIVGDHDVHDEDNKFLQRKATEDSATSQQGK